MAEQQRCRSHDGNVHLNSLSIENSPRVIQRNPLESVTISPGSKMIGSTICFLHREIKYKSPDMELHL